MLFILDLLVYITIYIFIIADTFLISFTCITLWDSRHFCSHNIQLPTWQNQPDTGKMEELEVRWGPRPEFTPQGNGITIQAGHQCLVWGRTEFSMYIWQEINTCCIFYFLTKGSLVILLYCCLAVTFLLSNSGAVNTGAWSLHGVGAILQCEFMSEHERSLKDEPQWSKFACCLPIRKCPSEPVPPPTETVVWLLHENSFRKCIMDQLCPERTSHKTHFKYRLCYSMF